MMQYNKIFIRIGLLSLLFTQFCSAAISSGKNDWGSYITYSGIFSADGILDRPLIIVEGFDVIGDYALDEMKDKWEEYQDRFLEDLGNFGYDIIYVNFVNNTQDMHVNTQALKDFIRDVNNSKTGNFEGAVIGESMGGILLRMALAELEDEPYDHQMSIYISLDSPHLGANIPVGIQTLVKDAVSYFPENGPHNILLEDVLRWWGSESATPTELNNTLNSVGAQQLIHNHDNGNAYYLAMQSYLDNLGYPSKSRNIAIVCGSNSGEFLPFNPGDRLIEKEIGFCALSNKLYAAVHTVSIFQTITVSKLQAWALPCIKVVDETSSRSNAYMFYDNCPGARLEFYPDDNATLIEEIMLQVNGTGQFSFVPVVSAIDLDKSVIATNWDLAYLNNTPGHTKDDLINANLTPFDDIYADPINWTHISLGGLVTEFANVLDREFMLNDYFIQNKIIENDRDYEYENITIGSSVNTNPNKNWEEGDVVFKSGTVVNIQGQEVTLVGGVEIEGGCEFNLN